MEQNLEDLAQDGENMDKYVHMSGATIDAQTLQQAQAGNADAMEQVMRSASRLVKAVAHRYVLSGGDTEDLLQEGMLALLNALRTFDAARGVPFAGYAAVCIDRRICSAVRAAHAQKHAPLNSAVSLPSLEEGQLNLSSNENPETLVIGMEARKELRQQLFATLSTLEARVLSLYLDGYSYHEIAAQLGKTAKSIDNAMQRIRKKAAQLLP